jgi:hypothetical protein
MKKKLIILLLVTGSVCVYFLFSNIIKIVHFVSSPMDFSVKPIFIALGMVVLIFGHVFGYVQLMDWKDKKFVIEDTENWWEKWDQI